MRSSDNESSVQLKLGLLTAYYESARAELIGRIGHRDNALLLFLAASTAVFGVAFGNVSRPALLFAVAPLGLGAAFVVAQHNDVIGALGEYCGAEVAEQAEGLLGGRVPDSWETSASLLQTGPRRLRSAVPERGRTISRFFTDRLYASVLLIVGPGIAGAAIGCITLQSWWVRLLAATGDGAAVIWATFLLWNSYSERRRRRERLTRWKAARSR